MKTAKSKKSNNKTIIFTTLAFIVLAIILIFSYPKNFSRQNSNFGISNQDVTRQNCLSDDCLLINDLNYPVGELPSEIKDALEEAINDEYKAYSTYEAVIKKFGNIRPFSMIIRAEEQHISSLKSIYDKYGLVAPDNNWVDKITVPGTVQQACQTGVDAEIANAALYSEQLLPVVTDYPDITAVFENLMNASQQKHLPAFENCN